MSTELTFEQRKELMKLQSECDIKLIRASVRPIITIGLVGSWVAMLFMLIMGGGSAEDIPVIFTGWVAAAFIWYFGERSISKAFSALKAQPGLGSE